jgi:type VI protein secretion system component Hcp
MSAEEVVQSNGGTTRRTLLRGGALGVGAVVGAMGLVSASESSAEAAERIHTGIRLFVGFAGLNLHNPVRMHSFSVGGDIVDGTKAASPATLVIDSSKYSPGFLQRFVEQTSLSSVVIQHYQPAVSGAEKLFLETTLSGATIVSYHAATAGLGTTSHPTYRDTLEVAFTSLMIVNKDHGTTGTWTVPAP